MRLFTFRMKMTTHSTAEVWMMLTNKWETVQIADYLI